MRAGELGGPIGIIIHGVSEAKYFFSVTVFSRVLAGAIGATIFARPSRAKKVHLPYLLPPFIWDVKSSRAEEVTGLVDKTE